MSKAPIAGQVKTRLSPPLTSEEAALLNRCFLIDIARAIADAGAQIFGIGCYTPKGTEEIYRDILPVEFRLLAQRCGTLDQRIIGAFADLFAAGFAAVCLVNSDSPTLPASTFSKAAALLSQTPDGVVIGPSDDGGYYLIGMKQQHRGLFAGIDWSTSRVLEQTVAAATSLRIPVHLLPAGYDVDDRSTLERLCDDLLAGKGGVRSPLAPATERFLRAIIAREGRSRLWPQGRN